MSADSDVASPSGKKKKSVHFAGSSLEPSGLEMDQGLAQRLFESGSALVFLDVPPGTEFGIDLVSWNVGQKFKGVKMIPDGVHFIYWSAVSKEGSTGPRTGFFHLFSRGSVLAKRYNPKTEDIEDVSEPDTQRLKDDLKNLDPYLGAYPYDSWKKWISLTNRISANTIVRLEPLSGKIQSVTELIPDQHFTSKSAKPSEEQNQSGKGESSSADVEVESSSEHTMAGGGPSKRRSTESQRESDKLPKMSLKPGTEIRYTSMPPNRYPPGSSPQEITKHSMDSTYQLDLFFEAFNKLYGDPVSSEMSGLNQSEEVLAELQFSFICFLVGQHYDSFEHWKQLLRLFCSADDALVKYADMYLTLITDMHFQIREVPDDFFVDIVSSNNFLVSLLTTLFSTIKSNDAIDDRLKSRAIKWKDNLSKKFNWDFDEDGDDDEDAPVIVEMEL